MDGLLYGYENHARFYHLIDEGYTKLLLWGLSISWFGFVMMVADRVTSCVSKFCLLFDLTMLLDMSIVIHN